MTKNIKQEVKQEMLEEEHEHNCQAEMYEYQMLSQQMQELQKTYSTMNKHKEELRRLESNIEDLSKIKGGENTLIPLGSGIFVKGKIDKSDNLLMNVGSGVVVEKSSEEALDTIRKQLAEVEGFSIQIEKNIAEISGRVQELQTHLQTCNHQH